MAHSFPETTEEWRQKAANIAGDSAMRTVIARSFDVLDTLTHDTARDRELPYILETMRAERDAALRHDEQLANSPLRKYFYGLSMGIEQLAKRLQLQQGGRAMSGTAAAATEVFSPQQTLVNNLPQYSMDGAGESSSAASFSSALNPLCSNVIKEEMVDADYGSAGANHDLAAGLEDESPEEEEATPPSGAAPAADEDDSMQEEVPASVPTPRCVDADLTLGTLLGMARHPVARPVAGAATSVHRIKPHPFRPALPPPPPAAAKRGRPPKRGGVAARSAVPASAPRGWHKQTATITCNVCTSSTLMTINGYVRHLSVDHNNATPAKTGANFVCACGYVASNSTAAHKHTADCDRAAFTLTKRITTRVF